MTSPFFKWLKYNFLFPITIPSLKVWPSQPMIWRHVCSGYWTRIESTKNAQLHLCYLVKEIKNYRYSTKNKILLVLKYIKLHYCTVFKAFWGSITIKQALKNVNTWNQNGKFVKLKFIYHFGIILCFRMF